MMPERKDGTGEMTVSETLSRTIGKLRRAWHGPPPTFMGHELTDPQAIAQEICANGTDEEQVRQFLGMSLENRNINKVEMILALRTLMEHGSEIAEKFRNTGIALGMGDYHDMGEDYTLAAIQYTIAYLHGQDPGFYHMATEIETRNRPRDANGYMDAVHFLIEMPDDPKQALDSLPDEATVGHYRPEYFEELAKAMADNPEIRQALRADFLVYRAASAVRHGLDRSRAWGMHMDGLFAGPTEHINANPYVRDAFHDRSLDREIK